MNDEVSVT